MSITSPQISIVISCFNYEHYVTLAIRSALEQSVAPMEIIVVNDGSTDGSAAALASFGERITVITQENRGQIAATNRGYAACRGDIVLFLDADDLLCPGALAAAVAAWTPQCTKVQFELEVINGAGERLGRRFCNYVSPYGPDEIRSEFERFGTYVWPVLTGNAYSRWFLEQVMPLTVSMGPDGYLNTIAPLYGEVRVVPQVFGLYRLHDSNQSYHGTALRSIGVRFAKQVSLRSSELRLLAQHAAARGVALPAGNLLDHDLPFVNYRLMLKKLGDAYEGEPQDSSFALWRAGMVLLSRRPLPMRLKLSHVVWMTTLLCCPRWVAARLIALRFNRAALWQPVRRALGRWFGKTSAPSGRVA